MMTEIDVVMPRAQLLRTHVEPPLARPRGDSKILAADSTRAPAAAIIAGPGSQTAFATNRDRSAETRMSDRTRISAAISLVLDTSKEPGLR